MWRARQVSHPRPPLPPLVFQPIPQDQGTVQPTVHREGQMEREDSCDSVVELPDGNIKDPPWKNGDLVKSTTTPSDKSCFPNTRVAVQEMPGQRDRTCRYFYDGYAYYFNNSSENNVSLKCAKGSGVNKCGGRGVMALQPALRSDIRITRGHNHAPNYTMMEEEELKSAILERCANETTELSRIFQEESDKTPAAIASTLTYLSFKSSMWRARQASYPRQPESLLDLGAILRDPSYAQRLAPTRDLFREVVGDGGVQQGHSAVFLSRGLSAALTKAAEVHMEGTFRVVPPGLGVTQLFTIMAMRFDHAFPVVSALMERRTTDAYTAVLDLVKRLLPGFDPRTISTDYEPQLQAAVARCFPDSTIHGCYFHYAQNLCQKCHTLGMGDVVDDLPEVKKVVKMAMVLPLLPRDLMEDGLHQVRLYSQERGVAASVADLLDHVAVSWLDRVGAEHVSVYGLPGRTCVDHEAYHKWLLSIVKRQRPSMYSFLEGLLHIDCTKTLDLHRLEGESTPSPRPHQYLLHEEHVRQATAHLETGRYTARHFLEATCHSVESTFFHHHVKAMAGVDLEDDLRPANVGLNAAPGPLLLRSGPALAETTASTPGLQTTGARRGRPLGGGRPRAPRVQRPRGRPRGQRQGLGHGGNLHISHDQALPEV